MGRFLSRSSPSSSCYSLIGGGVRPESPARRTEPSLSLASLHENVPIDAASVGAASEAKDEDNPYGSNALTHPWYFKDDYGNIQGPFTQIEMENWYNGGYFSMDLMVSNEGSDISKFFMIQDMFGDLDEGENPFFLDREDQDQFAESGYESSGHESEATADTGVLVLMENMWYFKDDAGKAQGCFTSEQMRAWYEAGYFLDTLPIAAVTSEVHPTQVSKLKFNNLSSVFKSIDDCFVAEPAKFLVQSLRRRSSGIESADGAGDPQLSTLVEKKKSILSLKRNLSNASLRSMLSASDIPPPGRVERSASMASARSAKGLYKRSPSSRSGGSRPRVDSFSADFPPSGRAASGSVVSIGSTNLVVSVEGDDAFRPLPSISRSISTPSGRKTTLTLEQWANVAKIQHKLSMSHISIASDFGATLTDASADAAASTPASGDGGLHARQESSFRTVKHAKTFSTLSKVSLLSKHSRHDSLGPRMAVVPKKKSRFIAPKIAKLIAKHCSASLEDLNDDAAQEDLPAPPPANIISEATLQFLSESVRSHEGLKGILFNKLFEGYHLGEVVSKMHRIVVKSGDDVVVQGQQGDNFYVIEKGWFDIYVAQDGEDPVLFSTQGRGSCFGEIALLYERPRAATVRAADGQEQCIVWSLNRHDFHSIIQRDSLEQQAQRVEFLKRVNLLRSNLAFKDLVDLADSMESTQYSNGDVIAVISAGGGDRFRIVRSGTVRVVSFGRQKASGVLQGVLEAGDAMGEDGLLKHHSSVDKADGDRVKLIADGKVEMLSVNFAEFDEMLGPLQDIIVRRWQEKQELDAATKLSLDADQFGVALYSSVDADDEFEDDDDGALDIHDGGTFSDDDGDMSASDDDIEEETFDEEGLDMEWTRCPVISPHVCMEDLQVHGSLGKGSFGSVYLVSSKETDDAGNNAFYALKVMARSYVVLNGWEGMVENERHAMAELAGTVRSRFVLDMHNSYVDTRNVYLLLELCPRGDLYTLLRRRPRKMLPLEDAQFFIACIVMGIAAIHSCGILYRDLKPENLMLDFHGYLQIADFGLAKKTLRTFTVCGTPDYMAPETLLSRGTGQGADWWALGVIVYEVLGGVTPFFASNPLDIYENILMHEAVDDIVFPDDDIHNNFCDVTKAFIKRFLHPKKTRRLGTNALGVEGITSHAFFSGVDVEAIRTGKASPPFLTKPKKIVSQHVSMYSSNSKLRSHGSSRISISSTGSFPEEASWETIRGAPEDHSSWRPDF